MADPYRDPFLGEIRSRTYKMGHRWSLGPEVLRTFDTEVASGVEPKLAQLHAISAWDVERPPGSMCADHIKFLHNIGRRPPPKKEYV